MNLKMPKSQGASHGNPSVHVQGGGQGKKKNCMKGFAD